MKFSCPYLTVWCVGFHSLISIVSYVTVAVPCAQITKQQVDGSCQLGRRFPHHCLSIEWTRDDEPVKLEHILDLTGTKGSKYVCIKQTPEGTCTHIASIEWMLRSRSFCRWYPLMLLLISISICGGIVCMWLYTRFGECGMQLREWLPTGQLGRACGTSSTVGKMGNCKGFMVASQQGRSLCQTHAWCSLSFKHYLQASKQIDSHSYDSISPYNSVLVL